MFRRDTKPIFTRSTPASIACTPHFDSRKLLFFMSSASAYPLYASRPHPPPTLVSILLRQRLASGVRGHHSFTAYALNSSALPLRCCAPWTSVRTSTDCVSLSWNLR